MSILTEVSNNIIMKEDYTKLIDIFKKYKENLSYKDLELINKIDKSRDYKLFNITQKNIIKKKLNLN